MNIGIPKSTDDGELRVAIVPETVQRLKKLGLDVIVEGGAGAASGFVDSDYTHAGATLATSAADLFARADAIAMVHAPNDETFGHLRSGQLLFSVLRPLTDHDRVRRLAEAGVTSIAMDMMPRISRAQKMDVLSSMSTIAGYKGVLLAASELTKMFPMMMTAAGTITPAKVLILGAGVAGLQAIATARRLGAVVEAFDVRPAVKEQVESLGARFVEVAAPQEDAEDAGGYAKEMSEDYKRKQGELVAKHAKESDIVISTALIPGKKAPILITAETVRGMKPGAVVMDLAAEGGGNCEFTKPGERVVENGVVILGPCNLPSSVPYHASQMYSRNVGAFLQDLTKEGTITLSPEDECVVGTVITQGREVVHARVRETMGMPPLATAEGSPA
ncbi:MAG TPA: Re/Si-specific NAD(P)(+) transhydrogenase subunit alpha [Phycisphaerae bacterium]|nr:Re/Si-specific NAD(P)(+) transhydrogenase subunit alpha [Phycisphaerae bacterium]HRW54014.1 Re/Si-specific NAD(P)(+) transhydrogenase subunit alpha [Phycisphaerae bacterium]